MSAIIQTNGLTKVFGANGAAVHALRGIDMTVARGEFAHVDFGAVGGEGHVGSTRVVEDAFGMHLC